jgi:hypothetical protein
LYTFKEARSYHRVEEVNDLRNLRTRLFILSVSLVATGGAVLGLLGGIKGLHDGDY